MKIQTIAKLAAAGLAALAPGCEYITPEGIPVRAPADGILTESEENTALYMLSGSEGVTEFTPEMQNLVNDSETFLALESNEAGFPAHRFSDDLHIYFGRDEAEMEAKFSNPNYSRTPEAFYKPDITTIYVGSGKFLPLYFFSVFNHELGHHKREDAYELPSQANRLYSALKMYEFSKRIGSLYAFAAVPVMGDCKKTMESYMDGQFDKYYEYGYLNFLVEANKQGGNLEAAMDRILRAPRLYLESNARSLFSQYPNICEANFMEFGKLLQQPGLTAALREHRTEFEVTEFTDYLHLRAAISRASILNYERLMADADKIDVIREETQNFLDKYRNNSMGNPYFRDMVMAERSGVYNNDLWQLLGKVYQTGSLDDARIMHDFAKTIIQFNDDYPCNFHPYECNPLVANPRWDHTQAYVLATYYSNDLISAGYENVDSMILLAEDYASRFYPTGNYHFEDTHKAAAVYTPSMLLFAGNLEENIARMALINSDQLGYTAHMCKAIEWYKRTLEAGCSRIPDAEKKAECESSLDTGLEQVAQISIDNSQTFYDQNCRIY